MGQGVSHVPPLYRGDSGTAHGDGEWAQIRVKAKAEVARLRSLPRTDPMAQIREGTWPRPTEEQEAHLRLMEEEEER